MNNKMIFVHTFELCCVPNGEIKTICKTFASKPKVENVDGQIIKYDIYYKSNKNGISYIYSTKYEKYNLGYLRIKVNVEDLLRYRVYEDIEDEYSHIESRIIKDFKKEFNEEIKKLPKLSRIDFKVDVYLNNYYREKYIKLLKKSYKEFGYSVREEIYDTSYYLKGRSTRLNNYDKYEEQIEQGASAVILASGIYDFIRLEVQVLRPYIRYRRSQYNETDTLKQYYTLNRRSEIFQKYMRPVIFNGEYYDAREARKIISKNHTPYMTNKLMSLLSYISRYGIDIAKKKIYKIILLL